MLSSLTQGFCRNVRWLVILLATMVAACAQLPALSLPSESDRTVIASQWLLFKTDQRQAEAVCMVELNRDALRLVATTPQGQTLLKASLHADGTLESQASPLLTGAGLQGETIVRDLQIALWPVDALRKRGWEVQETHAGHRRNVALDGMHWATVTYSGDLAKPQQILIERGNGLYSVELRTLEWMSP